MLADIIKRPDHTRFQPNHACGHLKKTGETQAKHGGNRLLHELRNGRQLGETQETNNTVDIFIVRPLAEYCSRNWTALATLNINRKYE